MTGLLYSLARAIGPRTNGRRYLVAASLVLAFAALLWEGLR